MPKCFTINVHTTEWQQTNKTKSNVAFEIIIQILISIREESMSLWVYVCVLMSSYLCVIWFVVVYFVGIRIFRDNNSLWFMHIDISEMVCVSVSWLLKYYQFVHWFKNIFIKIELIYGDEHSNRNSKSSFVVLFFFKLLLLLFLYFLHYRYNTHIYSHPVSVSLVACTVYKLNAFIFLYIIALAPYIDFSSFLRIRSQPLTNTRSPILIHSRSLTIAHIHKHTKEYTSVRVHHSHTNT